jgi:hypothetical protein
MRCQPQELVATLDRRLDMMVKKIFLTVPGVKARLFSCLYCATAAHIIISSVFFLPGFNIATNCCQSIRTAVKHQSTTVKRFLCTSSTPPRKLSTEHTHKKRRGIFFTSPLPPQLVAERVLN